MESLPFGSAFDTNDQKKVPKGTVPFCTYTRHIFPKGVKRNRPLLHLCDKIAPSPLSHCYTHPRRASHMIKGLPILYLISLAIIP